MKKLLLILLLIVGCVNSTQPESEDCAGVEDIDGNCYDTIQIGEQIWMKQNLKEIRTKHEHTASNQAENAKKMASIESNQAKILEILSTLKNDKVIMQKHLESVEKNETPRTHDGAAKNITTPTQHNRAADRLGNLDYKFHDGAADKHGHQNKPLSSSTHTATNPDVSISKATHPTPVTKSPVKKGVHNSEPHSNKTNPPSPVSSGSKDPPSPKMKKGTTSSCNAPAQRKKKKP